MEFHLLENGINSLRLGLNFYKKFLDFHFDSEDTSSYEFDENSYLKLAVLNIHHSVEILTKKVLSDVNELLIYSDISSKSNLLGYLSYEGEQDIPLDHSLTIDDVQVHTIEYSEAIKRLYSIFSTMREEYFENMKRIGQVRNQITHFGISKSTDYHTIIGALNRNLEFIQSFFLEYRGLSKDVALLRDVDVTAINGSIVEEGVWRSVVAEKFQTLYDLINDACKLINLEFGEDILSTNIHVQSDIHVVLTHNDFSDTIILTSNYPSVDSTIVLNITNDNDEEDIIGIIDHTETNLMYACKNVYKMKDVYPIHKKFWKADSKKAIRIELNVNNIATIIKGLANNIIAELNK